MRPLFAISEDLMKLNDFLDDIEGDLSRAPEVADAVSAWMDSLGHEESVKLDGYTYLLKQLDMEAAAARAEAEQWLQKARTREARAVYLKERLKRHLELTGRTEIVTETGRRITIQKNGGKLPVVIEEGTRPSDLPEQFVKVAVELDKDAIREALEKGQKLTFARLGERGTQIRVK